MEEVQALLNQGADANERDTAVRVMHFAILYI